MLFSLKKCHYIFSKEQCVISSLSLRTASRAAFAAWRYHARPYAKSVGIECLRLGEGVVLRLPANQDCTGTPMLPALHGGGAGFMEHAGMLHLPMFMGIPHLPKIIDFSIDYLRAGHYRDAYAQCQARNLEWRGSAAKR